MARSRGMSFRSPRSRTLSYEQLENRHPLDASSLEFVGSAPPGDVQITAAGDRLPDLVVVVNETREWIHGWTLDTMEQPGRTLLRLSVPLGNLGDGAMELRGGAALPNGNREVFQRIYDNAGGFRDVLAGEFEHHPAHDHTHFVGLAQYQLRAVTAGNGVGDIVVAGAKVSFCLVDSAAIAPDAGESVYLTCTQELQGISPGWADVYDQTLPDQWIDITGVPDGAYWLEVLVDPDDELIEQNELNNTERVLIALGGDRFEANDSFAQAADLGAVADLVEMGLSIHVSGVDDYFVFKANQAGNFDVDLYFQHQQGDIELEVYDSTQTQLGTSESKRDWESVRITADVAGETFYVRVYGYEGATNVDYDLVIDGPGTPVDAYEANNSFTTAFNLGTLADFSAEDLSIHAASNNDYFRFTAAANGLVHVGIGFLNELGDVELQVFDAAQTLLEESTTDGDHESVSISALAGQTYYIRVYGRGGATNPNYSLTVDVPSAPVQDVYFFSTTADGALNSTDGSPALSVVDADIIKLEVLTNGQYRYQRYIDGSDIGLNMRAEDIDAFAFLPDGSILISTVGLFSVPAPGGGTLTGGGEDLLRFVPSSVGETTSGEWQLFFKGSDNGLSGLEENIDAVGQLANGQLLISTTGAFSVPGISGDDKDLIRFFPTTRRWSLYFDGSDVGLKTGSEDINGLYIGDTASALPTLYLSTAGNFSVKGLIGTGQDVFAFNPTRLGTNPAGTFGPGLRFDGSQFGLGLLTIDGIHLGSAPAIAPPLAQTVSLQSQQSADLAFAAFATTLESLQPTVKTSARSSVNTSHVGSMGNLLLALPVTTADKSTSANIESSCGCQAGSTEPSELSTLELAFDKFVVADVL